jgi:hypothetical protein
MEPRLSDSCGLGITPKPANASRRTNVSTTSVVGARRRALPGGASACAGPSIPYATAGVGMSGNSESWWIALRAHCSSTAV